MYHFFAEQFMWGSFTQNKNPIWMVLLMLRGWTRYTQYDKKMLGSIRFTNYVKHQHNTQKWPEKKLSKTSNIYWSQKNELFHVRLSRHFWLYLHQSMSTKIKIILRKRFHLNHKHWSLLTHENNVTKPHKKHTTLTMLSQYIFVLNSTISTCYHNCLQLYPTVPLQLKFSFT